MFFSDLHVQILARGLLQPGEQLVGQTVTDYMPWWAFGLIRRQHLVLATDQRIIILDHRYDLLKVNQVLHTVESLPWSSVAHAKVTRPPQEEAQGPRHERARPADRHQREDPELVPAVRHDDEEQHGRRSQRRRCAHRAPRSVGSGAAMTHPVQLMRVRGTRGQRAWLPLGAAAGGPVRRSAVGACSLRRASTKSARSPLTALTGRWNVHGGGVGAARGLGSDRCANYRSPTGCW